MQELLSIAVGPRTDGELPTDSQLRTLLHRVGDALACRKVHGTTRVIHLYWVYWILLSTGHTLLISSLSFQL